jgi:hypothetical protein
MKKIRSAVDRIIANANWSAPLPQSVDNLLEHAEQAIDLVAPFNDEGRGTKGPLCVCRLLRSAARPDARVVHEPGSCTAMVRGFRSRARRGATGNMQDLRALRVRRGGTRRSPRARRDSRCRPGPPLGVPVPQPGPPLKLPAPPLLEPASPPSPPLGVPAPPPSPPAPPPGSPLGVSAPQAGQPPEVPAPRQGQPPEVPVPQRDQRPELPVRDRRGTRLPPGTSQAVPGRLRWPAPGD